MGKQQQPTVLMVAEKPSIADSIAKALSNGKSTYRSGKTAIHEFDGVFQNTSVRMKVTSVTGHVFSCDFPKEYSNWDAVDPKSLFSAKTEKKAEGKGGMIKHLASEGSNVDYLILWLDCDREGENICFEVISIVKPKMRGSADSDSRIYRAKFSAVTKSDINAAMNSLGRPNENEARSVDVRQELDLKVGVAFSRFQTRFFQGKYGDLDSSLVSYGPCQTPTLGFCVDRHDEISTFQPESFWSLDTSIIVEGQQVNLEWERGRVFDQEVAQVFLEMVRENGQLKVLDVKTSETSRSRPSPLNTVKLLQEASKHLCMGPHTTMQLAERLYLQGYVSYPRTESTSYPDSYDIASALRCQQSNPNWGSHVQSLLQGGYARPKKGVDAGDHPPITPVRAGSDDMGGGDMARLYDLITRYFIATVSPDAKILATKVKFQCGKEGFSVSGAKVLRKGFVDVLTTTTLVDTYLPDFTGKTSFTVSNVALKTGLTSPPGYLTESELIGIMEKNGIGTDASIATHINNICQRNYVSISSGRTLVPTALGIVLVHGYYKTDPELVLPKVRASIEKQCTLVAQGSATPEAVLRHALSILEKKFEYFVKKIERMDSLFEATFSPLAATGKPMAKCGKCSRYLKYVRLKPQRLYCPTCNETYNLPQNGTIKLYKELKCPLDNFEMVLFSLGNTDKAIGKTYPLCPYCYNYPPFENMSKMGCDSCLHPSCKHSVIANGVAPCSTIVSSEDDTKCTGMMVLDVNSKPNWKLCCNKCNTIVRFTTSPPLHSVKRQSNVCEHCPANTHLIEVEFNKEKKLPVDDMTSGIIVDNKYAGCVVCDELLNSLTEKKQGRFKHAKLSRGRGRRGRGGRGRHKSKADMLMSFDAF